MRLESPLIGLILTATGCASSPLAPDTDAQLDPHDLAGLLDAQAPLDSTMVGTDLSSRSCAGLSEAACKARPDCIADNCQGCGCNYSFASCRAPGDKAAVCPGLGCLQGLCCRSGADCNSPGEICRAPDQVLCGGPACPPNPPGACMADADCASFGNNPIWVCAPNPCCPATCVPGCTKDSDCGGPGLVCGDDHHCAGKTCNTTADCPTDFVCPPVKPSVIYCVRKTCKTDAECEGYCVNGSCYPGQLGTCLFPPV